MADSVSKTNIPVLRTPYGSEVPPKVPTCATDDVGSNVNPVYVSSKTIVASDADLGNGTKPIYMKRGVMTECEELAPRTAPHLQRKSGGGTTTDDVPTSSTPTSSDPETMIATKGYCDAIGARATKVVVSPKTTAGSVICAITVDGREFLVYNGGDGGGGTIETICVPLLTPMWFDHLLLGDNTWLESQCTTDQSTSNMHTQADFQKIYDHLNAEYSAGTSKTDTYTLNSGTSVSIAYKEAADGHKICATGELSKLNQIFNDDTIGTAWYFVLDTTNKKFHLPRTKYGFHGNKSYVKRTQVGEQSMRLFFYTGVGPTSAEKMDKVKAGVGSFTTTAPYGEVAVFQANNGQVEASGHKVVNPDAPDATDLVTVDYLQSQTPSKTMVTVNDYGDADLLAEIVVDGKVFQIHNKKTAPTSVHIVRYYSYKSGELLLTTAVADGETPTTPGIPSLTGWTFTGWNVPVGPCYMDTNYYGTWESTQAADMELSTSETASTSKQFTGYSIPVGANISARITGDIYHAANPNHSITFKLYCGSTAFFTSDPVYCPDKATVQIDTTATYTVAKAQTYFKLYAAKKTTCTVKWTLNMNVKFVLT